MFKSKELNIMAELELNNRQFEIEATLNGANKQISVKPDETSDGVAYYNCLLDGEQLTQIRLDEENKWEQIWGDLNQNEVDAIGAAITESVETP